MDWKNTRKIVAGSMVTLYPLGLVNIHSECRTLELCGVRAIEMKDLTHRDYSPERIRYVVEASSTDTGMAPIVPETT